MTRWIGRLAPVLLAAVTWVLPAGAETAASALPFGPGEVCNFSIHFGAISAGSATLSVKDTVTIDGVLTYHLESRAESSRFFSTFFKVDDLVESWWSVEHRVPLAFEQHIREGRYTKDESIRFDYGDSVAYPSKGQVKELGANPQDILSSFYYVRANELKPGLVLSVNSHSAGKRNTMEVRVLKRERIKVPAGTFNCVVVEPMLQSAGLFKQKGRLTIWLTDDHRRIPVLMRSKVAVGAIEARLERYVPGRPGGPTGGGRR